MDDLRREMDDLGERRTKAVLGLQKLIAACDFVRAARYELQVLMDADNLDPKLHDVPDQLEPFERRLKAAIGTTRDYISDIEIEQERTRIRMREEKERGGG